MSKALFFIENYYAGGSDKVAQLLLKNLDYEKKYLFINKANDTSIVLKELKDTDLEVIYYNLITIAELGEYANSKRKNLPLYVFLKTLNLIIRYPLLIFSFFYFYFKFKKINADVFIANNGGYPGGEFCRMATISASFLGIGNYHIVHSIPTRYFFRPYKLIEDYIDRLIDTRSKIICVSKDISKKLKIIRNIKQEPKVIHNGVQVSHQKKYIKTSTIKLLNVASLYDLKNQAFLLEVIRKLVEKSYINIELHFVGKEEEKGYLDKLRKLVKEYKIEDYVFFHGFSDPYSFYHNCDIFLLSSKIEGFPMVTLEAMSVGMPIISVNVGGVIEQIINEYNGFIVNKYDLDDFVKKVIYFLDNKEKIEEMGNNGYLHFNSSFSIEKMINNYHKELEIKI